jgi:hypothetical protein
MPSRLTTEEFIIKSKKVHGDIYNYKLSNYYNARTKVVIICDAHGMFEQTPSNHISGKGCPECYGNSKKDLNYFIKNLTVEECPIEVDGDIHCRCSYCKEYFKPTRKHLMHRIVSLNGGHRGERRLYCSDKCKNSCSIFYQKKYIKGFESDTSRPDQTELKKLVLERDNSQCQRCGSSEDLHCHHITGVEINPIESADIDNCITLCKECHGKVHSDNGCHYSDFKRQPCII